MCVFRTLSSNNYWSTIRDVLKAQQEVGDGISTFVQSRLQAEFLGRSTDAARSALKVSLEQYQAGGIDFTTVLTSRAESIPV